MVDVSTDELIRAFLEASVAAEAEPNVDLLRAMQEICASLARSRGSEWVPADASPFEAEAGVGLDESTILPDDDAVAPKSVRDLVREARGYVRLSLFDLAEGAVSRAMLVQARGRGCAPAWSEPATGQYRLREVIGGPACGFFDEFCRDASIGWLVACTTGRPTPLAAWPTDHPAALDPRVLDAGAALVAVGGAFPGFCTMCLALDDGLWFCGVDDGCVAMLRFPASALGGLISRLRVFDPFAARER